MPLYMGTELLTGHILSSRGLKQGYVIVRDGSVIESGNGEPPSVGTPAVNGLIVPGLLDMHTHLGDLGARGDLPSDLGSAVHPGGVKDRFLSSEREVLVRSYRSAFDEISKGVSLVLDYRESGVQGISVAREAVSDPRLKLLGRPYRDDDTARILRSCDGFGIPSLDSADRTVRDMARTMGKIYSVHASELYREDVSDLIDLDPDLVIHMIRANEDDWRELEKRRIPLCICPRANASFALEVPLRDMVLSGSKLVLGTDNALAVRQDMFREMEQTWLVLRKEGMGGSDASKRVLAMATGATLEETRLRYLLGLGIPSNDDEWPKRGIPANLFVLRVPEDGPWIDHPEDHVVRFSSRDDVIFPK
jgi:cytosine/adenosine deaminase-related metal-dependent hydrolase